MLKKLFLVTTCFISLTVAADPCADGAGTVVVGKDNTQLCVSKIRMNWWSAFSWCRAAGYKLATVEEACDGAGAHESCNNLFDGRLPQHAWTASVTGTGYSRCITSGGYGGGTDSGTMNAWGIRSVPRAALCLM